MSATHFARGLVLLAMPFGVVLGVWASPGTTISSFTPTSGGSGTVVTITGTNFTGATAVTFGGMPATTFSVTNSTTISATVGSGTTGTISVTAPSGTGTSSGTFYCAPTITSFTPDGGADGTLVTITGTNFTGATEVTFGSYQANYFTVNSNTSITAQVGRNATGTDFCDHARRHCHQQQYTFIARRPSTSGKFTPTAGARDGGDHLPAPTSLGATAVAFGGTAATPSPSPVRPRSAPRWERSHGH